MDETYGNNTLKINLVGLFLLSRMMLRIIQWWKCSRRAALPPQRSINNCQCSAHATQCQLLMSHCSPFLALEGEQYDNNKNHYVQQK